MSKLSMKLSYKNACILKHALRDKVIYKEVFIKENINGFTNDGLKRQNKELEEEKRALSAITEEIKRCGFKHNRQIF